MTTKINYIEMPANDLVAVKTFYHNVFGWEFTDYGENYTSFKKSGIWGGFYHSDLTMNVAGGAALVVLHHKKLTKIKKKIIKNGGSIIIDIFSFPGGSRLHFRDVCGNEMAVWSDKVSE